MIYTNNTIISTSSVNKAKAYFSQNTNNLHSIKETSATKNVTINISNEAKNIVELHKINKELSNMISSNKKLNGPEEIDIKKIDNKIGDILNKYRDIKESREIGRLFMEHYELSTGKKGLTEEESMKEVQSQLAKQLFEMNNGLPSTIDNDKKEYARRTKIYAKDLKNIWDKFLDLSKLDYISSSDRVMSYKISKEIDKVIENNDISPQYKEKLIKLQQEADSRYDHGDYKKVNMPQSIKVELNSLFDKAYDIYELPLIDNEYLMKASKLVFSRATSL